MNKSKTEIKEAMARWANVYEENRREQEEKFAEGVQGKNKRSNMSRIVKFGKVMGIQIKGPRND